MKYSKTGQFTKKQELLAHDIAHLLKELRKTCVILAKGNEIVAYKRKDYQHAAPLDEAEYGNSLPPDRNHRVPSIHVGEIHDSGADDEEYFEQGYITEE